MPRGLRIFRGQPGDLNQEIIYATLRDDLCRSNIRICFCFSVIALYYLGPLIHTIPTSSHPRQEPSQGFKCAVTVRQGLPCRRRPGRQNCTPNLDCPRMDVTYRAFSGSLGYRDALRAANLYQEGDL